jgi:hypothetical protein
MRTKCRALQHELMDCLRELRSSLSEAGRCEGLFGYMIGNRVKAWELS